MVESAQDEVDWRQPPGPGSNALQRVCFYIETHWAFDYSIFAVIIFNAIVLMTNYADEPAWHTELTNGLNMAFTVIFGLEAAIKLIGLGWRQYFSDNWNTFDFCVLTLAVLGAILSSATSAASVARAVRVLRFMRLFRVVKFMSGFRTLFSIMYISSAALVNAFGFLMVGPCLALATTLILSIQSCLYTIPMPRHNPDPQHPVLADEPQYCCTTRMTCA